MSDFEMDEDEISRGFEDSDPKRMRLDGETDEEEMVINTPKGSSSPPSKDPPEIDEDEMVIDTTSPPSNDPPLRTSKSKKKVEKPRPGMPPELAGLLEYTEKKAEWEGSDPEKGRKACYVKSDKLFYEFVPRINRWIFYPPEQMTCTRFRAYYAHEDPKKGWVKKSFIEEWVKDGECKEYLMSGSFPPGGVECPKDVLNLWLPFAAKNLPGVEASMVSEWTANLEKKPVIEAAHWVMPVEGESDVAYMNRSVELWKVLVWYLSNENEDAYIHTLKWVANTFQRPGQMSSLLAIQGDEGCGKSLFSKIIVALVGREKSFETDDPNADLFSGFNGRADVFFYVLNELEKKDIHSKKIKRFVTEARASIRKLYCEGKDTDVHRRILVLANEALELFGRRFSSIWCSNFLFERADFFNPGHQMIDDARAIRAIYAFCMAIDLSDFASDQTHVSEHQKESAHGKALVNPLFAHIYSLVSKPVSPIYWCKEKGCIDLECTKPFCKKEKTLIRFEPGSLVAEVKKLGKFTVKPCDVSAAITKLATGFNSKGKTCPPFVLREQVEETTKYQHFLDVAVIREILAISVAEVSLVVDEVNEL